MRNYGFLRSENYGRADQIECLGDIADIAGDGAGESAFLWKYIERASGQPFKCRDQLSSPSCVGQSAAACVDILQGVQIAGLGTLRGAVTPADAISIYSLSRFEVGYKLRGNRRLLSHGGSRISYAAEALEKFGCLAMIEYPGHDLSDFTVSRSKDWGRTGLPDDLEPTALSHVVKESIPCKSYEEVRGALNNGHGVFVGSNFGFKRPSRDDEGFLRPKGSWAHAMAYIGFQDSGSRPGVLVLNSWGERWIRGPLTHEMPEGSFWIDADVCSDMCRKGEVRAVSGFAGFVKQDLNFNLLG